MTTSVELYLGFLLLLVGERGLELAVSRRNARRALAAGAREVGQRHFRVMAAVHAAFPVACALEVLLLARPFPGATGFIALGAALAAQALRWWAVLTLGPCWNVRIIVAPHPRLVSGGPYRWLRHPNYVAVVVEIAAVPLVHGAWLTAVGFSAANALLLAVRIPAEERALGMIAAGGTGGAPHRARGPRREREAEHG